MGGTIISIDDNEMYEDCEQHIDITTVACHATKFGECVVVSSGQHAWIWMDGDLSKSINDMSCAAIDFYVDLFLSMGRLSSKVHGIIDPFGSTNNSCLVWTKQ